MIPQKVKAIYDFTGQVEGELHIYNGEILTVTNKDVGDGWWQGINSRGEKGIFPESYVEDFTESAPPSMPPPPLPQEYTDSTPPTWSDNPTSDSWGDQPYPSDNNYQRSQSVDENSDDTDWSDYSESATTESSQHQTASSGHMRPPARERGHARQPTVKKSFNRFSKFVQSGGEAFILGTTQARLVSQEDKISIIDTENGPMWSPIEEPYICSVTSPKKESKLKGLKSFIAYQITPTLTGIQVSRRYKHFDWLHERLEEKFCFIPLPSLPDKQVSGRYEDNFIERRKQQLQLWVSRICRHPVISRCETWRHFLVCTDEKQWKTGKRKAEKDELTGPSFFLAIEPPAGKDLNMEDVELQVDKFSKFNKLMDDAVRKLTDQCQDMIKRHESTYKRDCKKMGDAFRALGESFQLDASTYSQPLTAAIQHTSTTMDTIGELSANQPKQDLIPMIDTLHEYKGMLSTFPDIISLHKGALSKYRENPQEVLPRISLMSYAILAEMNHFQQERVYDFNDIFVMYLQQQVEYHRQIIGKLEECLQHYTYSSNG